MKILYALPTLAILSACAVSVDATEPSAGDIRFIASDAYRDAGYPFSEAVEVDGWVFLSGAVGTQPGTATLVPGGMDAEAPQVMDNIKASLERLGLGMEHIVKCTVMIDDMSQWPAFNEVYRTYFDGNYPARSAFGADGLALGAAIEVDCIARR